MDPFSSLLFGVLKQQHLVIDDKPCDEFYLLNLKEHKIGDTKSMGVINCLFTKREINVAVNQFNKNHPSNIKMHLKVGGICKLHYNNNYGAFVDKYFCKFEEYNKLAIPVAYCAMFTPREVRRAKERYNIYLVGGIRKFITKTVSKIRAFKNRIFCE